mmetsp:Transcript_9447/g.28535  ORF Transcript_9447/g.28535 Transcript_9447/m.28535 type:complete len:464 (+) Transcript_9447:100-1491(+)
MKKVILVGAAAAAGAAVLTLRNLRGNSLSVRQSVDVYVMLQLDVADVPLDELRSQLEAIKSAGVKGVMMDFWWSRVEKKPCQYDWVEYEKIVQLVSELGLKIQCVMAFHTCGEADGDNFVVKLPDWVVKLGKETPGLFYEDEFGAKSEEYISLGVDTEKVLPGQEGDKTRTPLEAYTDYFREFQKHFKSYIGSTITEVQVGMGPCGELRYPGYALSKWQFPGIGAFQCYDKNMHEDCVSYMNSHGFDAKVTPAKNLCGNYNSFPEDTEFFRDGGRYDSEEGRLFQEWYFARLVAHGDRLMQCARSVFGPELNLSCKISGIHWWRMTKSRAAEATSGYYNASGHDAYGKIAAMLKKHNAIFLFTCMEKLDKDEPPEGKCSPQSLVRDTARAASLNGVKYGGENALEFKKWSFYKQMIKSAFQCQTMFPNLEYVSLTLLRLNSELVQDSHLENLRTFIRRMTGPE